MITHDNLAKIKTIDLYLDTLEFLVVRAMFISMKRGHRTSMKEASSKIQYVDY